MKSCSGVKKQIFTFSSAQEKHSDSGSALKVQLLCLVLSPLPGSQGVAPQSSTSLSHTEVGELSKRMCSDPPLTAFGEGGGQVPDRDWHPLVAQGFVSLANRQPSLHLVRLLREYMW